MVQKEEGPTVIFVWLPASSFFSIIVLLVSQHPDCTMIILLTSARRLYGKASSRALICGKKETRNLVGATNAKPNQFGRFSCEMGFNVT